MDVEAARITELVTEACGLVEAAAGAELFDPDLATALELVRIDLVAGAFDAYSVQATDDACGAISEIDAALAALRALPRHEHATARAS